MQDVCPEGCVRVTDLHIQQYLPVGKVVNTTAAVVVVVAVLDSDSATAMAQKRISPTHAAMQS